MAELSIPYALQFGAFRAVVGNSDAASADADYVGWLSPDDGVTGLDSAEIREVADTIPDASGGRHGIFRFGRRPLTLSGSLLPDAPAATNAREQALKLATNGMAFDGTLTWTPTGSTLTRRLLVRRQAFRITGRLPKKFFVGLVSAKYIIESAALLTSAEVAATNVAGYVSATATAINLGDEGAHPILTITAPAGATSGLAPRVIQLEGGGTFQLKPGVSIPAGGVLVANMATGEVTLNGAPANGLVDFLQTTWLYLPPFGAASAVRLEAAAGTKIKVTWRHAWT